MTKGIATYYLGDKLSDRILEGFVKRGMVSDNGYYPCRDKDGKEVMRFICVKGPKLVVRILEVVTQYRGKNAKSVDLKW